MNRNATEMLHVDQATANAGGRDPVAAVEICHNCEEPLAGEPVYFDGEAYCCTGCVNGGPCRCTYIATPPAPAPAPASAPAPGALATPAVHGTPPVAPDHNGTTHAPPAGSRTMVLRVGTFDDQLELLRFAGDLEQDPRIAEVTLVRGGDLGDVWLSVRADDSGDLTAALHALTRFEVLACSVLPGGMEARVRALSEPDVPTDVLPQRQRPRIAWTDTLAHRVRDTADALPTPPTPPVAPAAPAARALEPTPHATPWLQPAYAEPAAAEPASAQSPVMESPVTEFPVTESPVTEPAPPAWEPPAAAGRSIEPPVQAPAPRPDEAAPADGGRMVGVDDRPGGAVALTEHVTLVVYPFRSFGALNEFQSAVRSLRGVKSDRVRRFYKGTLHLAVEYEDVIPLVQRLHDLTAFPWELVSESRTELELRLEPGRSFAAGESDR